MVGLFFGRESRLHCGPFLQSLMALLERHSSATVVFISRCASAEDTTQYFDIIPYWTAMPHEAAAGQRGAGLFKKFDLATVPALVLLGSTGSLICRHPPQSGPDGHQLPVGHTGGTAGKGTGGTVCMGGREGSTGGTNPTAEPATSTPQ